MTFDWTNTLAFAFSTGIALSAVAISKYLRKGKYISSVTSRKLLHISIGPLFLCTWPLFNSDPNARYFAAAIPAGILCQFVAVGMGLVEDQDTVQMMSRTGDRREILYGPTLYGILFIASTVIYWRSLVAAVALSILCAGDGFATLIGMRYPLMKLPWNKKKSVGGALAFFLCSLPPCIFFYYYFAHFGWISSSNSQVNSMTEFIAKLLPVTAIAMFVETLPINEVDNATVVLSVIAACKYFGLN